MNKDPRILDCGYCKETNDAEQRAKYSCPFVPKAKWHKTSQPLPIPGQPDDFEPERCPGYAVHDPRAIEVATGYAWREKGCLESRFPAPSDMLMDLIDIFNGAVVHTGDWTITEIKRRGDA